MRKAMLLFFLFVSVVVFGSTAAAPPWTLRNDAPALDISVSVRPVADDDYLLVPRPLPGSYRCSVLVHDIGERNRAFGTTEVVVAPGEKAERTTSVGPLNLHFGVRIAKAAQHAETVVTVTRDGRLMTRQKARVALRPGDGVRPVEE
jgi:hypothetical protein